MSARVYVLLDIRGTDHGQTVKTLRGKPGVVMADMVEGPPELIMVIEASDWQKLAERTMQALTSVEAVTEQIHLLPAREIPVGANTIPKSLHSQRKNKGHSEWPCR